MKWVQARINAINNLAKFISCLAHSLNWIGLLYDAKCSPELETFIGMVQKLFLLFFSSTQGWDTLKEHLKFSLKSYSMTWQSVK